MSERKTRTKMREGGGGEAFYVYCVGERVALARAMGEGEAPPDIEGGAGLELVEKGSLAAVASPVPLSAYGEETLRERVSDAEWMAARALRHERVVEHFSRRAGVVPLRFGAIYLRRDSIARALEERAGQLLAAVERLAGREEWGVNVYVGRAALREGVGRVSARLREMEELAAAAQPGQAYLLRKKIDSARDEEARAAVKRVPAEVEAGLGAESDGAVRLRALKGEAGEHGEMVA
ncbi:MAG TPA: GvpL/GvpF family gas vesicle protein, partial [Pyrinomonadaceae bacterium]|nr:GvpL/GvpF family gas vesicle protein [Pyrinomonadaceae bacterium]